MQAGDNVVNASLAPLHIRILKSVSHLRGPHSPQLDWVLQQCLPSAESTPWALEPQIMQAIVDGCREDNERLLELLSPEDADEMRRDPRWWSIEPYCDRPVATDDELQATRAELIRAVGALLPMAAGRPPLSRRRGNDQPQPTVFHCGPRVSSSPPPPTMEA